ncbi:MAG: hypothetical protein H6625_03795 [Bdellovibrionaceae bacterium]|nr:hypothetical protein [Pseudobdellovibrionaceae bacterium]
MKLLAYLNLLIFLTSCFPTKNINYWTNLNFELTSNNPGQAVPFDNNSILFLSLSSKQWGYYLFENEKWTKHIPINFISNKGNHFLYNFKSEIFLAVSEGRYSSIYKFNNSDLKYFSLVNKIKCKSPSYFFSYINEVLTDCKNLNFYKENKNFTYFKVPRNFLKFRFVIQKNSLFIIFIKKNTQNLYIAKVERGVIKNTIMLHVEDIESFDVVNINNSLFITTQKKNTKLLESYLFNYNKIEKLYTIPMLDGFTNPQLIITKNNSIHLFANQFYSKKLHAVLKENSYESIGIVTKFILNLF